MGEPLDGLGHPPDHRGGGVADRGDGDARAEVDQLVAVGVHDDAAAGLDDVGRQDRADPIGHAGRLPGRQLQRLRPRYGGDQRATLLDGHGYSSC